MAHNQEPATKGGEPTKRMGGTALMAFVVSAMSLVCYRLIRNGVQNYLFS